MEYPFEGIHGLHLVVLHICKMTEVVVWRIIKRDVQTLLSLTICPVATDWLNISQNDLTVDCPRQQFQFHLMYLQ